MSSFGPGEPRLHPTGAVMVVGGGIGGMQASLDLAEQGFKVYLVESKSAIGGHMARLDKTFPTNDCAMCAISPKLVETGRHLNIEILTDTEVLALDGEAGDFTARLRRKPRYVDLDKCVGCGDCARVCPSSLSDDFNQGLVQRRAAYRLYAQAIPAAYAIEKKGTAPCRDACPAGQRAQGYITLIREGRYAEALKTIKEDNPFPGICGRICNHPCELACSRGLVDEPLNIHGLKRFVTDWAYGQKREPISPVPQKRSQRVAVIGSGPCGLTAAQDLVRLGYGVTVFEALPVAGGMLRVGVPEYRLPTAIVDREVQDIVDLGIDLRLSTPVANPADLLSQGYEAVLIAVGAHQGKKLPVPGADLPDVLVNTQFLRDVRLGGANVPQLSGRRVLVFGGGNVAIDCARTAVRLGAASVAMACLESREAMPAHPREIEEAMEEGVTIYPGCSLQRIVAGAAGQVAGIECLRVTAMRFDAERRLTLDTEPGSGHLLPCDVVIFSIGQSSGLARLPADSGISLGPQSTVAVDSATLATRRPGVFAAGDATTGTSYVIEAVAAGHRAAKSIHCYLEGDPNLAYNTPAQPVARIGRAEIDGKLERGELRRKARVATPLIPLSARQSGFSEIEACYSEEQARAEAQRCLECGGCSECLSCVSVCAAKAIDHSQTERIETVQVGAVILTPGYQTYNARLSQEFGFGRFPNVVTSLQFERLLSASGPTGGHVVRPSDGVKARRIAFLQCVGSRDQKHDYCSAVCCMYAAKEAVMAKEHEPDIDVHVFMMDMRAFSKNYQDYYRRAREKYGVQYHRCRISSLAEDRVSHDLLVRYVSEKDGALAEETFDLVVLSVGMEIAPSVRRLAQDLHVELDANGFCATTRFDPLQTSRAGVYVAGSFRQPKDIPETVVEASAAAGQAAGMLASARGALAREPSYPPERCIEGEEARVGVFVCHCGSNIAGFVDVAAVAATARGLPKVAHAETLLYACSQDSIASIGERVRKLDLNRVVVASCTPRTHEPLFQDAIRQAGLNSYLFDMANIRNHCSWVHSSNRPAATRKANDLVRMSVARVNGLEALTTVPVAIERSALVIGGGPAGMVAALALADQGFPVHLVERDSCLGGNLRNVFYFEGPGDPRAFLQSTVARIAANPRITVHLTSELAQTTGFLGNFTSRLTDGTELRHGVTIVATGAQEFRDGTHGLGTDARIVTQQQFEQQLANGSDVPQSVVMLQCVGPAERYCGRLCCTTALKNALRLKSANPGATITVLYKDIRTYGFKERVYTEARRQGIRFVRYDDEHPPTVETGDGPLIVRARDPILGLDLELRPEMLVLSTPMVPREGARELGTKLKVPVDADGWFLEAHVKLRPVDFASEGLFVAGAAHYPKFLDETIVQAQAAASRAANILSRESLTAGGAVAEVDAEKCTGCLTCVRICPYGIPKIRPDLLGVGGIAGAAYIEPAVCQGCGACAAECPAKAINVLHYRDTQVMAEVDALFGETAHDCH
jgi:heterodisulfide reductase subunit A-like polyferredoxin